MKKSVLFIFIMAGLLFSGTLCFAADYKCLLTYEVAFTSGTGKDPLGNDPVVTVDLENGTITIPAFVFTETKTIPAFTVTGLEIQTSKGNPIRGDSGTEKSSGKDQGAVTNVDPQNFKILLKKDEFVIQQDGKQIKGRDLYGVIQGNQLELTLTLKVGKMPFSIKLKYISGV